MSYALVGHGFTGAGFGPHGMAGGMGFGLGFLNLLGTILFFIVLATLIRGIIHGRRYRMGGWGGWSNRGHQQRTQGSDDALNTARERFAKGDISADEFASLKEDLAGSQAEQTSPSRPVGMGFGPFGGWGRERALDIARMRLAKGEITAEEFATVKKTLEA
ncbi:MAG: SHOCT domain-containing protein [Deinococcota bacterium]